MFLPGVFLLLGWPVGRSSSALLVGIQIVRIVANKVAKPSQKYGVPYPVICRSPFGVLGANIPAVIRGRHRRRVVRHSDLPGVSRFGGALPENLPTLAPYADKNHFGYLGLSALGWAGFIVMWLLQAVVFWNGMEMIKGLSTLRDRRSIW